VNDTETDIETPEQAAARGREMLGGVLHRMGIEATIETGEEDDRVVLTIECEDVDVLIGRRGQVIDALQHLVNKMVYRGRASARTKPIVVDAGGYRQRHIEKLQALARKMGDRAVETQQVVELDPMTAYDRRIVHMALAEDDRVSTRSEGEGDDRRILVEPAAEARDETAGAP
jgi:spoIIIJ-associated protein